jgi:hypothetical protein
LPSLALPENWKRFWEGLPSLALPEKWKRFWEGLPSLALPEKWKRFWEGLPSLALPLSLLPWRAGVAHGQRRIEGDAFFAQAAMDALEELVAHEKLAAEILRAHDHREADP